MDLINVYSGPTPLAAMLQESLRQAGIESIVRSEPDIGSVPGVYHGLYARVVIARQDAEERADDLRACLASVGALEDEDLSAEITPAEAPGGCGDEPLPGEP